MKLLKDLEVETIDGYTVFTRGGHIKVIEPGRAGYYDACKDPIKLFERAKEESNGTLVEDANYEEPAGPVKYRITIKNTANSHVISDEQGGSTAYAEIMLEYYRKLVEKPRWIAFSAIKSFFAYGDGRRTVKITDEGGYIEYPIDVGPENFLISDHFNKPPMKKPLLPAGEKLPDGSTTINPHPLETGKISEKNGLLIITARDAYTERYCVYDGRTNYICTGARGKALDLFERFRKQYDLFWLGNGEKIVLKKTGDYYVDLADRTAEPEEYFKLLPDIHELHLLDDALYTVFHGGAVHVVFPTGVVKWDGAVATYAPRIIDDLYDAVRAILHAKYFPAEDPFEAYIRTHQI